MLHHVALVRTDILEEHHLHHQGDKNQRISELEITWTVTSNQSTLRWNVFLCRVLWLLVTANVHSSLTLVTLMMEALRSSRSSALTRATWRNIPEDSILHSHHHENLKSYILLYQLFAGIIYQPLEIDAFYSCLICNLWLCIFLFSVTEISGRFESS
jgi:hypothetical protein